MTNLTLSREMQNMAERLAENAHDIWAKKKKEELVTNGGGFKVQKLHKLVHVNTLDKLAYFIIKNIHIDIDIICKLKILMDCSQ